MPQQHTNPSERPQLFEGEQANRPEAGRKPRLLIEPADPDRTVSRLRDLLASAGFLYERGVIVRLAYDQIQGGVVAQPVTSNLLVLLVHEVCRPYVVKEGRNGVLEDKDVPLPGRIAAMYLEWRGAWNLAPLNGIATAPMLRDDGSIDGVDGYDVASGMWRENVPDVADLVPRNPTAAEASAALRLLRDCFRTFCFADAETVFDRTSGSYLVDTSKSPGRDESTFLAALLTAICRPSLHLAPGVLMRGASMSGAGAGKGLLARCISFIAFGREPHAVTGGATADEMEKRIGAELIQGGPVLFLDNLNNKAFSSDLLASAITERPARVRVLGKSQMLPLNAVAFVILTGNGLTVSEDLARRFIAVEFDPRTEDPEARRFSTDIRQEVTARRHELLAAALTIWRWGRLCGNLRPGRALGSFEQWCRWVRDPLIALGCKDPAERVSEAKERDHRRQHVVEFFALWWERHRDRPVALRELDSDVSRTIDPHGRGRQFISWQLEKMAGTRIAGFMLTRHTGVGKWGVATYALIKNDELEGHRGHRGHRGHEGNRDIDDPYDPYDPSADGEATAGAALWRAKL